MAQAACRTDEPAVPEAQRVHQPLLDVGAGELLRRAHAAGRHCRPHSPRTAKTKALGYSVAVHASVLRRGAQRGVMLFPNSALSRTPAVRHGARHRVAPHHSTGAFGCRVGHHCHRATCATCASRAFCPPKAPTLSTTPAAAGRCSRGGANRACRTGRASNLFENAAAVIFGSS